MKKCGIIYKTRAQESPTPAALRGYTKGMRMSYLSTDRDWELRFEQDEYVRLCRSLLWGYTDLSVAILLLASGLITEWPFVNMTVSWVSIGVVTLLLWQAISHIGTNLAPVRRRREVREAIRDVVDALEYTRGNLMHVNYRFDTSWTSEPYIVTAQALGGGDWFIRFYTLDDENESIFRAIVSRRQVSDPDNTKAPMQYHSNVIRVLNEIAEIISNHATKARVLPDEDADSDEFRKVLAATDPQD